MIQKGFQKGFQKGYPWQLTRREFYMWGGLSQPGLFRKWRSGRWTYWTE